MSRNLRSDRIKLENVPTLTFYADEKTRGRRSRGIPQLTCQGACSGFQPDVVQCANTGNGDWACHAELPDHLRMGRVEVSCEGYDNADDPYVLKGSCGLTYRLKALDNPRDNGYDSPSGGISPIMLLAIAFALYLLWRTFLSPQARAAGGGPGGPGGGGGGGGAPPWNPFNRPDGDDDDAPPPYDKFGAGLRGQPAQQRGNFWTGAAAGAAGAYAAQRMFGGRSTAQQRPAAQTFGRRDDRGEGPSYRRPSGGDSGGGSMRTSTGYGGTRNR